MVYVLDNINSFEQELESLIGRCAKRITDEEIYKSLRKAQEGLETSITELERAK